MFEFPKSEIDFFSDEKNLYGERFDCGVFARSGVFVIKSLLSARVAQDFANIYFREVEESLLVKRAFHPTEVSVSDSSALFEILDDLAVRALMGNFYEGHIGLHSFRIIRKDFENCKAVSVHQDTPYCLGFFDRISLFIALSESGTRNGGMYFFPGTHKFGYLGDAGEINSALTSQLFKLSPELLPGDCVVMDSSIWHGSESFKIGSSRIMIDAQIQPVSDPSTIRALCSCDLPSWRIRLSNREIFKNSRMQRAARD